MAEIDFIEYWALEFKKNPQKNRKLLNEFIDSQILIANNRLNKLNADQLIDIFNITNKELIKKLKTQEQKRKD